MWSECWLRGRLIVLREALAWQWMVSGWWRCGWGNCGRGRCNSGQVRWLVRWVLSSGVGWSYRAPCVLLVVVGGPWWADL